MGALEPAQVRRLTLKKLLDSCTACSVPMKNHHHSPALNKASLWNLLPGAGRGIASKRGRAQGQAGWGWWYLDLKQPQPASFWRCHCGETAELLQRPAAAGRDRWLKSAWMWNPTMAWSIWLGWLWNSSVHFVQLKVCETIPEAEVSTARSYSEFTLLGPALFIPFKFCLREVGRIIPAYFQLLFMHVVSWA